MALNYLEKNLELDSHVNTSCLGEGALVLTDNKIPVHVQVYEPALVTNTYRNISEVLLYDNTYTGRTYNIMIHQDVEILDLKHHLLCPMQACTNRVMANECLRLLTDVPTE